jgi:hypothetical protein
VETMKINELIKQAIKDPTLRINLFSDPLVTCKQYGIPVDNFAFDESNLNIFSDQSIKQGGYRP